MPAYSGRGRPSGSDTLGSRRTAPGTRSSPGCFPRPMLLVSSTGRCRGLHGRARPSARRQRSRSNSLWVTPGHPGARAAPAPGAQSNYNNPRSEPPDHGIGRSRGGLSTKIHALVDGRGRPLVIDLTAGKAGDSPMLPADGSARRSGSAAAGPAPVRIRSSATRPTPRAQPGRLRGRRITAVIPEPYDQVGTAKAAGQPAAGHPPSTPTPTGAATSSSAPSTATSSGAASPPATTSSPAPTAPRSSSPPSLSG